MNGDSLVLFDLAERARRADFPWTTFRPGIDIHRVYGDDSGGSSAALLRYAPGATIPPHVHHGYEHILVLDGEQADERGVYGTGTFIVNPPGSHHSVTSVGGCVVLVVREKPVVFTDR